MAVTGIFREIASMLRTEIDHFENTDLTYVLLDLLVKLRVK